MSAPHNLHQKCDNTLPFICETGMTLDECASLLNTCLFMRNNFMLTQDNYIDAYSYSKA